MNKLSFFVANAIETLNNKIRSDSPSAVYNYIIKVVNRYDKMTHSNAFKDGTMGFHLYLTLKHPTKDNDDYGVKAGNENELLQAVKIAKHISDKDMIGKNPKDAYFNKWINYAKNNDNGNSVFTATHNGGFRRIRRPEVEEMAMLMKQYMLENNNLDNAISKTSSLTLKVSDIAIKNRKEKHPDDISSKRANHLIRRILLSYQKAIKGHNGQPHRDYIDLQRNLFRGDDFYVKYSPIFNQYYVFDKKTRKPYNQPDLPKLRNLCMISIAITNRLTKMTQLYSNQDVRADLVNAHAVSNYHKWMNSAISKMSI